MSYFFTNHFKTQLAANQTIMDAQQFKVVLFRYAPNISGAAINPAWTASKTVAELIASSPGWAEVTGITGYPFTLAVSTSTRVAGGSVRTVTDGATTSASPTITSATAAFVAGDVGKGVGGSGIPAGTTILSVTNATTAVMSANATATATGVTLTIGSGSRYVMYTDYKFTGLAKATEVRAIGITRVASLGGISNPLIFVSNTPVGSVTNVTTNDALTSSPDTSNFQDATNRWLFGWGMTTPDPVEGPLVFSRGSPDFEVSGSQHCWLYPQRANMIANPNFEAPGMNFWSSNGTPTRVAGTAPGSATTHGWAGQFADPTPSYVNLTGAAGCYIEGPDIAALGGAKKITIEFDAALADWTPSTSQTLIGQSWAQDNAFHLHCIAAGYVYFNASLDGVGVYQYAPSVVHALGDTTRHTVGGIWTADDGTNSTYQPRIDGANHGTLKTAIRFPDGVFNSSRKIHIGHHQYDDSERLIGKVYGVKIWANDVLVASPDFKSLKSGQTSVTDAQGNVWTFKGAASAAGDFTPLIVESNQWPTLLGESDSDQWTVQLMAKGDGLLKVGLVYWDADYRATKVDWGDHETWTLSSGSWLHVATHRHTPEGHIAMLRLEFRGANLIIDKVLAERGYLKDWPYFDGDEKYGARDDFSWYGGTARQGASYSLWYNHRKAVTGRLFARTVDPNDPTQNVTDEDMEEQGLVYRWVPAGITVVPHLDVFYPWDVQNPLPAKPAGVLPYYSGSADGVVNPWS